VGFDVLVFAGLTWLVRRPSWRLAALLAVAVTADAVLTALEAAFWNLPQLAHWLHGGVIALACTAPALAAVTLWGAAVRLKRAA
jgi:phosphatidylglycerol lysyltransferase